MLIAVIGGGASGMMAAITAAENDNNRVLLFERQQRVGKKLSVTGNGRCNLSNGAASGENGYFSVEGEKAFIRPAFREFSSADTLRFFKDLGLLTVEDTTAGRGRIYPLSDSANSVVDVLRFTCDRLGVESITSSQVLSVRRAKKQGFTVKTAEKEYSADKVIIACGGVAGTGAGGVNDGYELLKVLGHSRTGLYPVLVPVLCDSAWPRSLKGVRAEAGLALYKGRSLLAESRGELQFTEKGISGPAAFEISRAAALNRDLLVKIDFLCDYETAEILDILRRRAELMPELSCGEALTGIVHNRLGKMLVKYAGADMNAPLKETSPAMLEKIAFACKDFEMKVTGTNGFESAQVTAGGIRTSEFDPETLESRLVPGLYACGEVLDVDGACGGFNLQWAWSSGRLAGRTKTSG